MILTALTWLADVFGAGRYSPHSICLVGDPVIMSLFVLSDGVIGLSYFVLAALLYLTYRNKARVIRAALCLLNDPVFLKLFSAFIFACACTHITMILTLYQGVYVLDVLARFLTAGVSFATAIRVVMVAISPPRTSGAFDELLTGETIYEPQPLNLPAIGLVHPKG